MKVLVIPEDPTLDRYILKPVVEQIFADLRQTARVIVLENPRLRGVAQAMDEATTARIVQINPTVDLFLTMVDRDGDERGRPVQAERLEQVHPDRLLVCLAIEEIEVWMLALHRETIRAPWREIRSERDPKERFAAPFLKDHAPRPDSGTGHGRSWAMREIGQKWRGVLQICPELAELQRRISTWLGSRQGSA